MNMQPIHSFIVAAKSDFWSKYIKTGSFSYINIPNGKRKLNENDETDSTSVINHSGVRFVTKDIIIYAEGKPQQTSACSHWW